MLKRFSPALVVAAGLVLSAFVLRSTPDVVATGAREGKPVFFRATFTGAETKVMGTVPGGKTLLLKDFFSVDGRSERFEVLADGDVVLPFTIGETTGHENLIAFSVGIAISGGKEVAIKCLDQTGDLTVDLYVAGILE